MSIKTPDGYMVTTYFDGNTAEEYDTRQCAHCGMHWRIVRGSGRIRGFCGRCCKDTCGAQECDQCVPYQMRVEEPLRAVKLIPNLLTPYQLMDLYGAF